jgi:predicted membrane channel-forming protein YqfA (hemolysin III family)
MSSNHSLFMGIYSVLSVLLSCGSVYFLLSPTAAKENASLPKRMRWLLCFGYLTVPILSTLPVLHSHWKKHTLSCVIILASLLVYYFCMIPFFLKVSKLSKKNND